MPLAHDYDCLLFLTMSDIRKIAYPNSLFGFGGILHHANLSLRLNPSWSRQNMIFERSMIYSLCTPYSIYFRMVIISRCSSKEFQSEGAARPPIRGYVEIVPVRTSFGDVEMAAVTEDLLLQLRVKFPCVFS